MSQEVGKTDETEWEDEQIGGETWLRSHDKIKEWMDKMMIANDKMNK